MAETNNEQSKNKTKQEKNTQITQIRSFHSTACNVGGTCGPSGTPRSTHYLL